VSSAFAQEKGAYVPIFEQLARRAYFAIANLTWSSLLIATIVHGLLSYVLLALSGEAGLTGSFVDCVYYYMTTATTVGYGDLSPQTPAGRIWALVLVLPGSISLFTACLGKAITDLSLIWRGRMNGLGDYSLREGHTLILGWQPIRTPRLVKLLAADCPSDEKISLSPRCSNKIRYQKPWITCAPTRCRRPVRYRVQGSAVLRASSFVALMTTRQWRPRLLLIHLARRLTSLRTSKMSGRLS